MRSVLFLSILLLSSPTPHAQTLDPAVCPGASRKLSEQLELYTQLSQAFLQSNQTLTDVYSTFGERLKNATPTETQQISEHFQKSAEALRQAHAANESLIQKMREETERLRKQVEWCTGKPAEVRLFANSVQLVQQTGRTVKVRYRTWLGLCERFAGATLIRDATYGYRVQVTGTRTNCGIRNERILFAEKELDLGPLEPGRHELRFDVTSEGDYFSIPVEVRD